MRDAMAALGGDPTRINPLVPADLVIDHSVQVDRFGTRRRLRRQRRARVRAQPRALRAAALGPAGLRQLPRRAARHRHRPPGEPRVPGAGRACPRGRRRAVAFPDTLVGTDSHTTMINGLGVLGWGVGGIEAEAVLLGQPLYAARRPRSSACKLTGALPAGATATDLVLTVTEMLRKHGVVGKFVEFYGAGLSAPGARRPRHDLEHVARVRRDRGAVPGRRRDARATCALTGRADEPVDAGRGATPRSRASSAPTTRPDPEFDETLELDLATVEPSLAGPRRPQDRVALARRAGDASARPSPTAWSAQRRRPHYDARSTCRSSGESFPLGHGSVVIAAITSCTNTSNPSRDARRRPAGQEGGRARPDDASRGSRPASRRARAP